MSEIGQKLIQTVRDIADANPDFTYVKPEGLAYCVYFHGGKPSCIMGHALSINGFTSEDLDKRNKWNILPINSLDEEMGLGLEIAEWDWLCRVQNRQDKGDTWGESVQYADAVDEACKILS